MINKALQDMIDNLPVAYMEVDAEGRLKRANRIARSQYSPALGDIVGKFVWDLLPPEEKELSRADFQTVIAAGKKPPVTRRSVYNRDGTYHTHDLHRKLILNAQGQVAGVRTVSIDVTESDGLLLRALNTRRWLDNVVDALAEALIVTDALGFVRSLNPAAERFFGFKAEELVGKPIEKGLPILCFEDGKNTPLDFSMTLDKPVKAIATMLDAQRRTMRVEISTSPILDHECRCNGVASIWRRLNAA